MGQKKKKHFVNQMLPRIPSKPNSHIPLRDLRKYNSNAKDKTKWPGHLGINTLFRQLKLYFIKYYLVKQ